MKVVHSVYSFWPSQLLVSLATEMASEITSFPGSSADCQWLGHVLKQNVVNVHVPYCGIMQILEADELIEFRVKDTGYVNTRALSQPYLFNFTL